MSAPSMERAYRINSGGSRDQTLPFSLPLELSVRDVEVVRVLSAFAEGAERDEFALTALRIGVLALQQAQGVIDGESVRREGERLLGNVEAALTKHQELLHDRMTRQLQEYFDPQNGRFQERVERLIRQDGELEQVLRRSIGAEDSEMCQMLVSHVGEGSPLLKLLDPREENGLLTELRMVVEDRLSEQREHVLKQFSLDNEEGALARFLRKVKEHHDGISGDLTEKIDRAVGEFSLDDENSALSRLVGNVKTAQETITKEFSLDEEKSALSRLRSELVKLLEEQSKTNQEFQEQVKVAIGELQARKAEAARSTRHGADFEQALFAFVEDQTRATGDIAQATGNSTGLIKNNKKGDVVLTMGPETAAPDANIVLEAKQDKSYDLKKALAELEEARHNRAAQVGIFVFSQQTVPENTEPLARYGADIVVVWDAENPTTDVYLKVAITLARALCVREQQRAASESADFEQIDKAILEIEKKAGELDEIKSSAESIKKSADKILDRQRKIHKVLEREAESLRERTGDLKQLVAAHIDRSV